MNPTRRLHLTICLMLAAFALVGCGTPAATPPPLPTTTPYPTHTPAPTQSPYPTYTPISTLTPYPTYTSLPPTPTSTPMPGMGEWVDGHFWSLKVVDIRTEDELDGERPLEDVFLIVEVQWRSNDTQEFHRIEGIDFELVDEAGDQYDIAGMIYQSGDETEVSQGPDEQYHVSGYRIVRARGNASDTYKLVYDLPSSARALKLWFGDFPLIALPDALP